MVLMNPAATILVGLMLLSIPFRNLVGQDEPTDDPRANVNLGMPISAPLNPTAQVMHLGLGTTIGSGYNFTRRHAVIGEFMWNNLYPTNGALGPLRLVTHNADLSAGGNLFAFTANYRFELRGEALGTYLIAGGGWYYRNAHISQRFVTGSSITCNPTWLWWGFSCESGLVGAEQTIAHTSSNALGANGGIGFTARVGDAPYRVYVEARYHYAPSKGISTQLVAVTVGIRY
jgi:hypothetical protein